MERHFDEDLDRIKQDLLRMSSLTEKSILESIKALKTLDASLAETVMAQDQEIDDLENQIEEACIDVLARHQPVAKDLRFVTTAMRFNNEMECIADLSSKISKSVVEISGQPLLKQLIDIPKLGDIACEMLKKSIQAFIDHDGDLAKKVILSERDSNELRNLIQEELINDYMVKDGTTAPRAVPLLLIARYLERICDHAKSIAEDVVYMVEAEVVKHHPEKLQ